MMFPTSSFFLPAVQAFQPGSAGSAFANCHGQQVQCDFDFRGIGSGNYAVTWRRGPAVCFLNDRVEKLADAKSPYSISKEEGVDMLIRCK